MKPNAVKIHALDNVVTVLVAVREGEWVHCSEGEPVRARQDVPAGHKLAVTAIRSGDVIRKYGHPIGSASEAIAPGDHVHTHNLAAVGG